jgi:hypothetical protein
MPGTNSAPRGWALRILMMKSDRAYKSRHLHLLFPLLLLFLASWTGGCGSSRRLTEFQPATLPRSAAFLEKKLLENNLNQLSGFTAKGRLISGEAGINTQLTLVWKRDSMIWLNIKKFGLEAARALVTPDSVYVINRLDQTYLIRSLATLQHEYSLPAGFELLESLLLGVAWIPDNLSFQSTILDSLHQLRGANARYLVDYRLEEGQFLLRQARYMQATEARTFTQNLEAYGKLSGIGQFAYLRRIDAFSPETGHLHLEIEFSEIEANAPQSYRFEIPQHYQRLE